MTSKKINSTFFALALMGVNQVAQSAGSLDVLFVLDSVARLCSADSVNFDFRKQHYNVQKLSGCARVTNPSSALNTAPYATLSYQENSAVMEFDVVESGQTVTSDGKNTFIFALKNKSASTVPTTVPGPVPSPVISAPSPAPSPSPAPVEPVSTDKLIITPPRASNETHLPGCIGANIDTRQELCAYDGSIGDEAYAVKFKFDELKGANKAADIAISTVTRAGMSRDLDIYRKFDMAISTTAGDFTGLGNPACAKRWATNGTELRINGKQFTGKEKIENDECPLSPNVQYYINVKAASPGCQSAGAGGVASVPNYGCRVTVYTVIPN